MQSSDDSIPYMSEQDTQKRKNQMLAVKTTSVLFGIVAIQVLKFGATDSSGYLN